MKLNPQRIIVNAHSALGDTMEYQPFFLMLRTMFPQAEIHCTCNQNTIDIAALYPPRCDYYSPIWVDFKSKEEFNERFTNCVLHGFKDDKPADLIILMDRRTELVKLALSIGKVGRENGTLLAKKDLPQVVTFSYFPALYTPRLRFLPWLPRKKIHEIFHYQFLLKCINSERYRACFDELDLEQARPHFNEHENAQYYLEVKRDLLALGYNLERDTRPLVVINPLSGNSDRYGYNYKHEDYVRLGHELAHAYPQLFFVITCYGNPPFSKLPLTEPNLKLWNNQGTLNHLLAMLSLSSLVIVPSTGPAHVADIMGKDVVEMMPDYDCPRWIANGMGQLASRQKQPSVGINQCRYQILRQNWKDTEASYEQHFQAFTQMCHDFIEQRTLKLFTPRNLAQ